MSLMLIPILPLAAALLAWFFPGRNRTPLFTLAAAAGALALATRSAWLVAAGQSVVGIEHWVEVDSLSALVLCLAAWVGALAALYSWGYLEHGQAANAAPPANPSGSPTSLSSSLVLENKQTSTRTKDEDEHELRQAPAGAKPRAPATGLRVYYTNFNLFLFALLAVPVLAEPNLVWIGIELTALFSVLLVAYENTREALEAAWKYIALMFMGASVALLGFLMLFWAFRNAGGDGGYSWSALREWAPRMSPVVVRVAFVCILVGFGTKVGLAPLHTWLPDAHSQAPAPACALLSAVKTTVALYAILRLTPLLDRQTLAPWLLGAGLFSTGVAAFLLLRVRDYKRLFAFSTVEHMGIVLTAVGLGATAAGYAALAQIVSHSVTKAFCFFAAGAALTAVGTREIASVRGLIHTSPLAGVALLFGGLGIAGAPPLAVFLSEFSILKAGLARQHYVVVALLALFIVIAFFGVLVHLNHMIFSPGPALPGQSASPPPGLPWSCRLALLLAAVPVLLLGLYVPAPLHRLLTLAAPTLTH